MGRKGFALTELVLVIVIVGICSVSLITVIAQVLATINQPQVIATAAALAEKEADRVLTGSFANAVAESNTAYTGNFSKYSHQVLVTTVDANDKIVEVRVSHAALGYVWLAFLRTNY